MCECLCVVIYWWRSREIGKMFKFPGSVFGNLLFNGSGEHQKSYFKGHSAIKDFASNLIKIKTQTNGASCMQQVFWSCLCCEVGRLRVYAFTCRSVFLSFVFSHLNTFEGRFCMNRCKSHHLVKNFETFNIFLDSSWSCFLHF